MENNKAVRDKSLLETLPKLIQRMFKMTIFLTSAFREVKSEYKTPGTDRILVQQRCRQTERPVFGSVIIESHARILYYRRRQPQTPIAGFFLAGSRIGVTWRFLICYLVSNVHICIYIMLLLYEYVLRF